MPPDPHDATEPGPEAGGPGEYRIEELATRTGTTVRTIQAYRNRRLLPPPRRAGRVAWYSEIHIQRLELLADLLSRGYSLNAIGELLDGLGRGEQIKDLVGLDSVVSAESIVDVTTPRKVGELVGRDPQALDAAVAFGMFSPLDDGDYDGHPADRPYLVELPETLRAGAALVAAGIPPEAVVAEGVELRSDADAIARRFVKLAADHLIDEGALSASSTATTVTELVGELLPFASTVVNELLRVALNEQIHEEVELQISRLLDGDTDTDTDTDG